MRYEMEGIKKSTYNVITVGILLFLCSSCGVNKYLGQDDYLITNNKVILEDTENKIKEKSELKYELSTLISQKPNGRFLLFFKPKLRWYLNAKPESEVQTKFNHWFRRKFMEPPVLYKREVMYETAQDMQNYLYNKGYFDVKVLPSNSLRKGKKATINYKVIPGDLYTVDTLILESKDPVIDSLIPWLSENTILTNGAPIDVSLYNKEVSRITDTLRNNGYAFFYPNYIKTLESDTTGWGTSLTIYDEIIKPFDEWRHRAVNIGSINVYSNFNGELGVPHRDTLIDGLHYRTVDKNIGIKPKVIRRNVFFNEGELFDQSKLNLTNKQLTALGIYKFVNIRTSKSTNPVGFIDIDIILSKQKKQFIDYETDINNSERPLTDSRSIFLGTGANVSYLNRNLFGGAERVGLTLEGGVEFNLTDPSRLINSLDLLARLDVQLPEYIDVPGTWKLLSLAKFGDWSLLKPSFLKSLKDDGIPIGSLSYNSFIFRDFYGYNSIDASWSYDLKKSARAKYSIKTVGLTLFQSETQEAFEPILISNTFLEESLGSRLFTGFLYSDFNYLWTSEQSVLGETWQFRFNHEVSGLETLLANKLFNKGRGRFDLPGDLEFAHFTSVDVDLRYFKEFKDGNVLALRTEIGVATPFSNLSESVPFVKQFFVGGPNSIRSWFIRELGPGEFFIPENIEPPFFIVNEPPFFQTGDFKFAFNLEYRFKFIPFFQMDGALFLDGGNIWTLKEDPQRPGSQLLWRSRIVDGVTIGDNFIDQIALGTGAGIRIDFTYVIFRFDVGLKTRSPFVNDTGSRWYFDQWGTDITGLLNYNIALGHPF